MAIDLAFGLLIIALAMFLATRLLARRRAAKGGGRRHEETEDLLRIYAEGGWRPPKDRLLQDPNATSEHAAGWHAQRALARLYVPVGLRPKHRDEPLQEENEAEKE